jgi:hypothetical protein
MRAWVNYIASKVVAWGLLQLSPLTSPFVSPCTTFQLLLLVVDGLAIDAYSWISYVSLYVVDI